MQKLIVVLGPTASGKSDIALKIAKDFGGFLISADSRQVYKDMDIITGKDAGTWEKRNLESRIKNLDELPGPSRAQRVTGYKLQNGFLTKYNSEIYYVDNIPEYMADIIEPDQDFSLYDYQQCVYEIIDKIANQNYIPILVGGTGLYISSIIDNYILPEAVSDKNIRKQIEKDIKEKGLDYVYKQLIKCDPVAKDQIDPKNTYKVIRALEVCKATGEPFTKQIKKGEQKFDVIQFGIDMDREVLYDRINQRVDKMLDSDGSGIGLTGWDEVSKIIDKYGDKLNSVTGIGYLQLKEYFDGNISKHEAIENMKRDTRHYAKRQITWFRRDKRINWIKGYEEVREKVKAFI